MGKGSKSGKSGKRTGITKASASRIQSHSGRTGKNKGFAKRSQSAADRKSK